MATRQDISSISPTPHLHFSCTSLLIQNPPIMMTPRKDGRGVSSSSPRKMVPLKGRFVDGVWCCNCPNRPPAVKFQTKNQGPNHGRWFYTCQQAQNTRCDFFLWNDDAENREKLVVLSNSRSEPEHPTGTPMKQPPMTPTRGSGLLTPQTERRRLFDVPPVKFETPTKSAKAKMMSEDTEGLKDTWWDDVLDDGDYVSRPKQPNFLRETTRKVPRTASLTSPGKRKLAELENDDAKIDRTSFGSNTTVGTMTPQSRASPHIPPPSSTTPTPSRYANVLSADSNADSSELARSAVAILDAHHVVLPKKVQDELVALMNKHDLKTKGIVRGRDISRLALKKKDEQIKDLNERIESLKAQLEMSRTVIDGMKMINAAR